jgi:hypothetical protein
MWLTESRLGAQELSAELALATHSLTDTARVREAVLLSRGRLRLAEPMLLAAESPASAGGELAGLLYAAAEASRVRLGSEQNGADTASGHVSRVAVTADATGDIRAVANMLLRLERGPVWLRVRELSITQPDLNLSEEIAEVLGLRVVIEALYAPRSTLGIPSARNDS